MGISGYKVEMKLNKDCLAAKQNNYSTKIVNPYIVYDLDAWPRNPTNSFKLENCLLGVTNVAKCGDKEKQVNSDYEIIFDLIFGVDNSSSCHADNRKTQFLLSGEGPTYGINGSFGSPTKK